VTEDPADTPKLWLPAPDPNVAARHAIEVRAPVSPARDADQLASRWATDELGLSLHRLTIPPGAWLVGVELRTMAERGIVDLRLRYSAADGSDDFTPWAIGIERGRVHELSCGGVPYAMGVTVRARAYAGLVNLRVLRAGGSGTEWAVPGAGGELRWAGLEAGAKVSGIEVRAQPGDGIVNLRVLGRAMV